MSKTVKVIIGVMVLLLLVLPWWINPYLVQIMILTITYAMLGLAFMLSMKVGY